MTRTRDPRCTLLLPLTLCLLADFGCGAAGGPSADLGNDLMDRVWGPGSASSSGLTSAGADASLDPDLADPTSVAATPGGQLPALPPRPPDLSGAGQRDLPSPAAELPVPQESAQAAQELAQRFDLRITGPAATPENLAVISEGLAYYRPEHLEGLDAIHVRWAPGDGGVQGTWTGTPGRPEGSILFYARTGRSQPIFRHTVVHEVGHHMSLAADPDFGMRLDRALGRRVQSFPSEYATKNDPEKLAENLAFGLLGPRSELRPAGSWAPPEDARQLLRQEFGAKASL